MGYYPVSAAFERALKFSHTMVARLDVEQATQTTSFDFVAGEVIIDFDDRTRRSLDCEIVDPLGRVYDIMQGLVDPFQSVLRPWRGIKYPDGTTEMVPCGEFYPADVEVGEGREGAPTWKIRGYDGSTRAQDELGEPVFIPAGTNLRTAVPALIRQVWPGATFRLSASRFTTPTLLIREDSIPWTAAQDLSADFGEDLTVDRDGAFISDPRVIAAAASPVWTFAEGLNATSWEPKRTLSADHPVNVVIVLGTNPAAPGVSGIAYDNDRSSKTYRYGPNGERRRVYRSEKIVTIAQATAAAKMILGLLLGKQDQVQFQAVPNPALDVGDTVALYRARMGLNGDRLIVSHVELPLVAEESMAVTCRRSILAGSEITPLLSAP